MAVACASRIALLAPGGVLVLPIGDNLERVSVSAPGLDAEAWADGLLSETSVHDVGGTPQPPARAVAPETAAVATSAATPAAAATTNHLSPTPHPPPPPSIERITLLLRVNFHELVLPASSDAALFSVDRASKQQCDAADGSPAQDYFDASVRDDPARLIFGRLRALRHATACMRASEPLPVAICYTAVAEDLAPQHAFFAMTDHVASGGHRVRTHPSLHCDVLGVFKKGTDVFCGVRALENEDGWWLLLAQVPEPTTHGFDANSGYHDACRKIDDGPWMLAASRTPGGSRAVIFLTQSLTVESAWMAVVDFEYALGLQSEQDRRQAVELQLKEDMLGTGSLRAVPRGWALESDFELVRYTCHHKIRHPTVQDFEASWLEEFPRIAHHHPEHLVSRLLALHRVVQLLDEVVEAIIPVHLAEEPHDLCDSSFVNDPFAEFDTLRQLYPLSTIREGVVAQLLDLTTKKSKHLPPIIQIDRRRARALRQPSELSSGPTSCNGWADSVFHRTFAALQSLTNRLAYRFNDKCGQWWEVNYVGEGIIDQGGGFRDLLAEISDELCPCDPNFLPVTPLFVRSPNNIARVGHAQAGFVVNPDCRAFAHYQWLGKLMGAALRSDESITLLLPPQFWKTLTGEPVTWDDFSHVDAQTVTFLDQLAAADEESFDSMFEGLAFTTPVSSARVIDVIPGGSEVPLTWQNRMQYIAKVRAIRMAESGEQIAEIRAGMESSVPRSVLSLLTWQEAEVKVCGSPTLTVDDIQNNCRLDGMTYDCLLVRLLFAVLGKFSSSELSQFLRFVTGRRRMPVWIHISAIDDDATKLPKSATCANTLYLPPYPTEAVMEQKLRYAIHNCVSIHTDTNPW